MKVRTGTSGFSYAEWKGPFYPEDLANGELLRFYATRLPAVEINNTFHRMPKPSVLAGWAAQVPEEFRFAIKASRRITHIERMNEPVEEVEHLLSVLGVLGARLGVVLFQLPPNLKKDLARLSSFLDLLGGRVPAAFEFRHESWVDDEVVACLAARGAALVAAETDAAGDEEGGARGAPVETVLRRTAPFAYLRLRRSAYTESELRAWLARLSELHVEEAYVFFKHEDAGAGPRLAAEMLSLAG